MSYFNSKTNQDLVEIFNNQVGNKGWVSAKAVFLQNLKNEFIHRHIDISNVLNETGGFNLNQNVNLINNKLVVI